MAQLPIFTKAEASSGNLAESLRLFDEAVDTQDETKIRAAAQSALDSVGIAQKDISEIETEIVAEASKNKDLERKAVVLRQNRGALKDRLDSLSRLYSENGDPEYITLCERYGVPAGSLLVSDILNSKKDNHPWEGNTRAQALLDKMRRVQVAEKSSYEAARVVEHGALRTAALDEAAQILGSWPCTGDGVDVVFCKSLLKSLSDSSCRPDDVPVDDVTDSIMSHRVCFEYHSYCSTSDHPKVVTYSTKRAGQVVRVTITVEVQDDQRTISANISTSPCVFSTHINLDPSSEPPFDVEGFTKEKIWEAMDKRALNTITKS